MTVEIVYAPVLGVGFIIYRKMFGKVDVYIQETLGL